MSLSNKIKILIADKLAPSILNELREKGYEVIYDPDLKDDNLVNAMEDSEPNILVVRSTPITDLMIRSSRQLGLIVRAGAGVNTIDVDSASRFGVFVANCPGKNAAAVAELAMGLILSLDRSIPDNVISLRQGNWNKKQFSTARGVKGSVLGLIGIGSIGKEVAKRALAFEMTVIAWSRSLTPKVAKSLSITQVPSLKELARQSDIVSVHIPATNDTNRICNNEFFKAMKDGAFFINTSRGSVVDESALLEAISQKGIRAALDVFDNEPNQSNKPWNSSLSKSSGVYGTHHIGASTAQAENETGNEVLRIIHSFASTGAVPHCVNLETHSLTTQTLTIRHMNKVGVLAKVLNVLQHANINILEMENLIFQTDKAAIANIRLGNKPNEDTLAAIKSSTDAIISVTLSHLRKQ